MLLVFLAPGLNAAEYRAAEVTAPRSVEDIDSTLSNVSNQILFNRETGVGIRTLQHCFREYFDISVTDYLKTVRLDAAYRELKAANGEGKTVTKVALQNGFTHLGRFSVAYHVRFGEMPSETLATMPGAN